MGIITKEVGITPVGKVIKYYKDKGYDVKYKQYLMVKVEDLPKESRANIEVVCDLCTINKWTTTYSSYNKSIENTGSCVCKDCIPIKRSKTIYEKYGDYNAGKIDKFKEKMQRTNLERYGVVNYSQTKEFINKKEQTMLKKYGVKNSSQLPDYKDKYHQSCIEKYGEDYKKHFTEKAFNTFYNRTGYKNPSQSPEIREKVKQTCISRFGCEYSLQSPEVREKITKTLYANSSQKISKQQCYINNLYQGILNFPVKHYNVDIYLPNDNLTIEYDGGFHRGNVITERMTKEEFDKKEIIRNNIIKREGYKQMRIVSKNDKLPSDQVLLQMLQYTRIYFSKYPNHSWIEFNILSSTVFNAEYKDGLSYSFGALRTIKDSDLKTTKQLNNK